MYYVHEKELSCPKCARKFIISWKEWREIFNLFMDEEPCWFKCPFCRHEFGDEEKRKRETGFHKTSKIMKAVVVILVLTILVLLGYLVWIMFLRK